MQNFHEPTQLISDVEIVELENRLRNAWSRDTAYPKSQEDWPEKNKAHGQCAVTSLIVNDLLGGTFVEDKNNHHIWNVLPDGSQHDFSREQFVENVEIKITGNLSREDILESPGAIKAETHKRYLLLKKLGNF